MLINWLLMNSGLLSMCRICVVMFLFFFIVVLLSSMVNLLLVKCVRVVLLLR